ncbi:hypothetical protein VaNZ11_011321 [Volvox africanus]|uniref:Tyrosine-protein kinase catalytic domain-containing protein n=1 Tax=Volvox africanus TaxID=51714 RepID=A0ABQ5SB41_9CHLO|nr:hypothetical protein VaNZ11_011321 [Volvox africanus]
MNRFTAGCGSHLQDRLRSPSKRGNTRLLLLALAVTCLLITCDSHQNATAADFLDALARSQSSLPGSASDIFPASIQTVTPGIAADLRALHYDPARSPAAVIKTSAKLTGAVALLHHQGSDHLDGKREDRVLVDLGSASRGLLFLNQGVELILEHITLAGFEQGLTQIAKEPTQIADGLGGKNGAKDGSANIRDDASVPKHVATLISERLIHRASRGTLMLNDVILALGHCSNVEWDIGAKLTQALTDRGVRGHPDLQPQVEMSFGADAHGNPASQLPQQEDEVDVEIGESRVDAYRHLLRGPGQAATITSATITTTQRRTEQNAEWKQQSRGQANAVQSTAAAPASESGFRRTGHLGPLSGRFLTKGGAVTELRNTFVWCTDDFAADASTNDASLVDDIATAAIAADAAAGEHRSGARKTEPGRRRLTATVGFSQVLSVVQPKSVSAIPSMVQGLILVGVMMVAVGGVWLRRLLSCACLAPSRQAPTTVSDASRTQNGSRSFHKPSTSLMCNSHNHALSGLSRFSAQLRKGEDSSVRDGSIRRGSILSRIGVDISVRGGGGSVDGRGGGNRNQPCLPELPALVNELSEIKPAGQGRLAITLQGIWQHQQRVVVKVLTHAEDCCFMLEQVGEVWTRLTHANIVTCVAAETFPASALASRPAMAELIPQPTSTDATLQTWLVLERCENGSLAAVLAQRYQQQQQQAVRKAVAAAASTGATEPPPKEAATARQGNRRQGHSTKGKRKSSTDEVAAAPATPSQDQGLAAPSAPPALEVPSPSAMAAPPLSLPSPKTVQSGEITAAAASGPSSCASGTDGAGEEGDGGNGSGGDAGNGGGGGGGSGDTQVAPLPGLLPMGEVLSIAHDVASGLAYLHSLDLCHGDLRAENVMVQTIVLPSGTRASGGESPAIDLSATAPESAVGGGLCLATVDLAGLPYVDGTASSTAPVASAAAVALGSCHTVDEGLAVMYGSTGGHSDVTDGPGGGGVSCAGGAAVNIQRRMASNISSCSNTANASCTGVPDSSGHGWSNSLRQSNGFMTGSTYTSTMTTQAGGGGPGGGGGGGRSLEPGSVDDRLGPGSLQSQGLGSNSYFSHVGRPMGQPYPLSGYNKPSTGGCHSAMGKYGNVAAAGAGAAEDGATTAASDGAALASTALATSAVVALSRAMGVGPCGFSQQQPQQVRAPALMAAGGASFARRQSNSSLSAANTNSGNDVTAMSKALSGLKAWPESPHEGRHAGGPAAVATTSLTTAGGSSGGAPVTYNRMGSGAGGALPSPARKTPLIGGLKSALLAPDAAKTMASESASASASALASASSVAVAPPMTPQPQALAPNMSAEVSPFTRVLCQAPFPDDDSSLASPVAPARLPSCPSDGPGVCSSAVPVVSPRVLALQINEAPDSAQPPSPSGGCGGDGCSAGPSTPTGGGSGGSGGGIVAPAAAGGSGEAGAAAGRSRNAVGVGVVCTIAAHQGRRSSGPSAAPPALPVIRRIAKLTDPWLSLARMPPDCAGGPWTPGAAEAMGVTSGADVSHLPPELLLSGRLHPSSDVYSLGILMWRMLSATGEAPYAKLRPAEVAYKVVVCGMRPSFSPAVPEVLRRLVEDCWLSDPAARPTVQQVIQRVSELQANAVVLQNQWRERHALFGLVSTVPISAVAVLPLQGEQNEVAARWADAAGIKLLRNSTSLGGASATAAAAAAIAAAAGRRELSGHASFGGRSSRGHSGTFNSVTSYPSIGVSGSAAHLYQQPPPPTPPAGPITNMNAMLFSTTTMESINYSNTMSEGHVRGSHSNHRPTSPFIGHLPVQQDRRGLDPF